MTWKEFLSNYKAEEDGNYQREIKRLAEAVRGKSQTLEIRYPPPERFPKLTPPFWTADFDCNIWGVIPFHGNLIALLPPAVSATKFDEMNARRGISSKNIDKLCEFARDTGRLAFALAGNPTSYESLDFLEPLFTEFRPPGMHTMPIDLVVGPHLAARHRTRFLQLSQHGFLSAMSHVHTLAGYREPEDSKLDKASWFYYSSTYVFLQTCGYSELAGVVENAMVHRPMLALQYLDRLGPYLVDPILGPPNLTPIFATNLTSLVHQIPGSGGLGTSSPEFAASYDIGRFLLHQIVRFADSPDGCRRVMEMYDDEGLASLRAKMYRAVQEENPDALSKAAEEIKSASQQVWDRLDRLEWANILGKVVPTVSIGIVGALATGIPGEGLLSGLGFPVIDKLVGGRISQSVKGGIGRLAGVNHLVALYDFKTSLKDKKALIPK
jgi:hypothetical protein